MPHDVITFGEAMIRLSPPNFQRLEQAASLDVRVGGAELNTAVALARLGRRTAWVSRLTDNPLGRLIANRAREAGVSTEHVVWTDAGPADAGRWMNQFLQFCDVLVTTEEDVAKVLGIQGEDYEAVAREVAGRFPLQVVAITLRQNPLVWKNSWTAIALHGGKLLRTRT